MNAKDSGITRFDLLRTLWRYRVRGALTAIAVTGLAVAYAWFAPRSWEASQAVVLHDDAATQYGAKAAPRHEEDVKNMQQTLLEIVASRSVLKQVLEHVGPPRSGVEQEPWPSEDAIEDLRSAVNLVAPQGTHFGKTDVFYLKVKDLERPRAVQLVDAVYAETDKRFGQVRADIAKSMIAELTQAASLAEESLARATERLAAMEKDVGVDLVALRMLYQSPTSDTAVFRTLTSANDELRACNLTVDQDAAMLQMLGEATHNPRVLSAAPKELLDCHPGLARLIQGLGEARLRSAAVTSRLTLENPEARSSLREEAVIDADIQQEIGVAIQGVQTAKDLVVARRTSLQNQIAKLHERLQRLATARATYANLAAQVDRWRNYVDESQHNLAQAKATLTAATHSSLLSAVDVPDGGARPAGPTRAMIGLIGLVGGLFAGAGIVFLTAPMPRPPRLAPKKRRLASLSAAVRVNGNGRSNGNGAGNGDGNHGEELVLAGTSRTFTPTETAP